MPLSVTASAHSFDRLRAQAAVKLLRADNLAPIAAILATHFGGTHRVMPVAEFISEVEADLPLLRDHGFAMPLSAQEYVSQWAHADYGYLLRRPGEGREETVELTAGAAAVIAFLTSLDAPRTAVTSSRFANVTDLLTRLARDTDPDSTTRLEALRAERDRLDAEIARVEGGDFESLPEATALERLADILVLAGEISSDFSRVSADLEALNHDLRDRIIRSSASRADVLEDVFQGVDLIEDSPSGRTFRAFHAMVLDAERAETFDASVADIMGRPFARGITPQQRHALRDLLTSLQTDAATVRATMTGLSRSLRQFVQTSGWREHRRLEVAITEAQRSVLDALKTFNPIQASRIDLTATSTTISSIAAWALHNPGDLRSTTPLARAPLGEVNFEALRQRVRESEIDIDELMGHITDSLIHRATATVGEVLDDHPATQGLASVIGLLRLGQRHGLTTGDTEVLHWTSVSGTDRHATAPRHVFTAPPKEWT